MSRALFAVVLAFPLIALANPHYRPDVEVNVPPEVFSSGGQSAQPCTQCCVYQDKNYSEGAVIKAEGILLQCQRDDKTLREGANKQVISSQADSLIKISRIWADFFPANTSNQPI